MSERLLEACRRALVVDPTIIGFVGTNGQNARVYPSFVKAKQAMDAGKFPLIAFSIIGNRQTKKPKWDTNLQLEIVGREDTKRTMWLIEKQITSDPACFSIRSITQQSFRDLSVSGDSNPPVNVWIGVLNLVASEDNVYDVETNTHRIRLQYAIKYHTDGSADPTGYSPSALVIDKL